MRFIKYFGTFSNTFLILLSIILVILIGFIRHITGPELALSLFYLLPIAVVSWNIGRWAGIFISFASALSWLAADLTLLNRFSSVIIPFMNQTFRLIVFITIACTVFELKNALENQKRLARTDPLTNISNRLAFFELATIEINKARRYKRSISMLYIDIDNFKIINDTYGHHKGDTLLSAVAETIRQHIRVIDIVARFGGDEFGVLMSRTGADASYSVAVKLNKQLLYLAENKGWPVTFSMGLVTYERVPVSVNEMIIKADTLMYSSKKKGKNRIERAVITNEL